MTEKITFMGVEVGEICATCHGVGNVRLVGDYKQHCPDCRTWGFRRNLAYDALERFAYDLVGPIDTLTLTKETLLARIREFENAVGYVPLEVHLATIHAPQRKPDETQAKYEAKCKEHLDSVAKALAEYVKNPHKVHLVGSLDHLTEVDGAFNNAEDAEDFIKEKGPPIFVREMAVSRREQP